MTQVNVKYYILLAQLWKASFWQKNYLKNANAFKFENLVERSIFVFFSTLKDIIQTQYKTIHWISQNLMIISDECFLFNLNVNTSLKFLWARGGSRRVLRGYLGTQCTLFGWLSNYHVFCEIFVLLLPFSLLSLKVKTCH